MKADIRERISQQTERESKRSTIIIITLSTLLILAFVALAVMRTETIKTKDQAKKLEHQNQANQTNNKYVDVDEFIKQNKSTRTPNRPTTLQKEKQKPYNGLSKAITIDDLPPSKNPISIYTPPSYTDKSKTQNNQKRKSTHKVNWGWDLRAGKYIPENQGVFYYTISNNTINTTTVCNNYEYGSIRNRNCRKAAKQWFKDNCSQNFMAACGAAAMRP